MTSATNHSFGALLYLWPRRTLYIGQLAENVALRQGAATLTVSLDKEIRLRMPDSDLCIDCHSLILPPGFQVSVETGDATIANCNLDVFGRDHANLLTQATRKQQELAYALKNEHSLQQLFREMLAASSEAEKASKMLDQHLTQPSGEAVAHAVDARVERVVEMIQSTASENVSLEELAGAVHVSSQRLIQLFKQQTGIPIRRYRLWHRMFRTAGYIAQGFSMTDAAMNAGFSDSAHFAHTFRSMFGTTPSNIFVNRKDLKIFIGH